MQLRYPNITGKTPDERQNQMERYIRSLVDQINFVFQKTNEKKASFLEKTNENSTPRVNIDKEIKEYLKDYLSADAIEEKLRGYLSTVYPVGAIYISFSDTNPSELFGGTWERIKDRFLLGAGDTYAAGNTGGESNVKLVSENIPRCYVWSDAYGTGYELGHTVSESSNPSNPGFAPSNGFKGGPGYTRSNTLNIGSSNNTSHNNMPPYIVVHIWKRIA